MSFSHRPPDPQVPREVDVEAPPVNARAHGYSKKHDSDPSTHEHPQQNEADIFNIRAKNPSITSLKKWKSATFALNATRRFRYTARVDEEALRQQRRKRFRTSAHAVRAVNRFNELGAAASTVVRSTESPSPSSPPSRPEDTLPCPEGFNISPSLLVRLLQDRDAQYMQQLGSAPAIASRLHTNLEKGIDASPSDIQIRQRAFGTNTYPRQPPRWYIAFFWDACKDPTLIILMVCALLSLIFGIRSHGWKEGWYDGASIAFAVLLVITVTSSSDYRQALQFMALNEEKRNIQVQVLRGGRRIAVSIFDLVVGDLVVLNIGDQVPADGLFVQGHSLSIDESSMTGESDIVRVDQKKPFLLSGCKVEDGFGTMLVTGVGTNTEWGQLMAAIGDDNGEETPLQVRLNGVATFVGKIGLVVALLVLIILIIFYFVGHKAGANNSGKFKAGQTPATVAVNSVVDAFAIAVTIIVVAVPEGLPLAVTLTLAYSMKKMMVDRALVRRLSACETMGGATAICSDKTGTLTLNQMTVVKAWVAGKFRTPATDLQAVERDVSALLLESLVQNSSGSVFIPTEGGKEPEVTGSPTEKAVLTWGLKVGMDLQSVKSLSTVLHVETFNSTKKRAGVAVRVASTNQVHVHWKGAAEIVLHECDGMINGDNSRTAIDETTRSNLLKVIEEMATESLRCIAFAYKEVADKEVPKSDELLEKWAIPESQLCLIAIVGIKDPCRPGVPDAVGLCQAAGIKVRMVTGDNLVTAKAIATECGILQDGIAVEGVTFRNYSDEEKKQQLPKISVMARSSPSDKLLMVKTLREMGHVVAVTGDGTNDAPALHEADIGLAMGIQGTEVAKDSSDIIILDDNFASVVKVVRWGRSVYFNIQKFIQFQLTVNMAALTINFVAAVSSGDVPLTAVQLLWVNLIMDTLGALALATEPPTNDLMCRPPIDRKDPLISLVMWRNIFGQALYQVIVLLTLQFKGKEIMKLQGSDTDSVNTTVIFNAFVLCQLFNEVNARKPQKMNIFKGLFNNKLFIVILSTTLILQVIIVEFLNKFASTVKLDWQQWVICLVIAFMSWPIAFLVKLIPVPQKSMNMHTNI
ncbi:hypothetical protein L7F22_013642 [Adiantum nelumboides]|nr:hypothetical protein [Adiantum nelumboides]